jgi:hypothetical protein
MPDDSKGAAQRCSTDQGGKQHHCLSFHTGSRASTRATCIGRHSPMPRGVRTARRLSALARPFLLVMPAARSSAMTGATSAAIRLARAIPASQPAR